MSAVVDNVSVTSEQHVELGKSRCQRDFDDLTEVFRYLHQFNPFNINDGRLRSLASGLAAESQDKINCDEAETVERLLQESLDNISVSAASVPSSKKIRSLIRLSKAVKINNETVHIDPTALFMRLIVLVDRADDMSKYFHYELTPIPCSLFKDSFMRHPIKSLLTEALIRKS